MPFRKGDPKPPNSGRRRKAERPRLAVEYRPIGWFRPYERNPRKNDKAVDRIRASIREFGFAVPILARSNGEVIDGHLRLKGAVAENLAELPVILCDGWTPAQVKAFRLMVNRSVTWADWDTDALAMELADIKGLDLDLSLTGFDTREIDALLLKPNAAEDDVPPVPDAPVTRAGDLWLLGPHRLLCGDATKPEEAARVLNGAKPLLMVTDPPYGVGYDPAWRDVAGAAGHSRVWKNKGIGTVRGDDQVDWSAALRQFPGDVAYVWHAGVFAGLVAEKLDGIKFVIRNQIIWKKQHFVFGRGVYHWGHEPCWYAVRAGARADWRGDHKQTTVWEVQNLNPMGGNHEEKPTGHGTQKPVELMRRPILNHTVADDSVYDPFLGSGSTLVAAELTGRVCFGIEIDPAYCDVIVTRWQNLTGKKATLEGHAGVTFEHVKAGRRLGDQDAIKESAEELIEVRA